MSEGGMSRKQCPNCGEETEFIQFATGDESTVVTSPEQVGDGILELRSCDCGTAIENVLTADKQRSVQSGTDRIDCVLCDETSETPEAHEQHMAEVHDA